MVVQPGVNNLLELAKKAAEIRGIERYGAISAIREYIKITPTEQLIQEIDDIDDIKMLTMLVGAGMPGEAHQVLFKRLYDLQKAEGI